MVIFGNKMTVIKFSIEWWDLILKMSRFEFLAVDGGTDAIYLTMSCTTLNILVDRIP